MQDDATTTQCVCLPTLAAMSDLRCSSIQASVRSGHGRGSQQHHQEILPPEDPQGRGLEDRPGRDQDQRLRQGRDEDGQVRPHREERKGSQGV